ncbi:hypothetical protein QUB56_04520 [Microcoleus sp. AR_TQ3_B6]|uniref:hypothetical protein n=1 Tax=Microcoleus sp. AR_TQ3_B6 TaxID=3055284 RepID=UPI002FCFE6EC
MKARDIISLQALGAALAKLDSSVQLGELEENISREILALEKLAEQNNILNEIYTKERLDLKEQYQAKSKDKRYDETIESIYSTDAINLRPSFTQPPVEVENPSEIAKAFDNLIASFNQIKTLYAVENPLETFQIIIEQEAIAPLILEGYDRIRALFPTERLGLEVKTDPENVNWRSLWITIYTKLEVDEAFAKLKNLDRTWWLDASLVIPNNILNIDLGWE